MNLGTGAIVSLMKEQTYKTTWNAVKTLPMQTTNMQLHTYTGDSIPVLAMVNVTVNHKQQIKKHLTIWRF